MSTLIFHWTISKNANPDSITAHARKRILSRWNLMAKAFNLGGDDKPVLYCVTNDPEVQMGDAEVNFKKVATLDEALALVDGELVFIEEGGAPIEDFKHPENAVYIFGSDYGELPRADVSISSKLPLHSEIAAGIILSYRYRQWP